MQFINPNASGSGGPAGRRSMSLTPEGRERSPATREKLTRWPGTQDLERERMKEVWCRMEKEQTVLLDTWDGMLKLAAKGTTDLWRLKQRLECLMKGFENKICEGAVKRPGAGTGLRRWPGWGHRLTGSMPQGARPLTGREPVPDPTSRLL